MVSLYLAGGGGMCIKVGVRTTLMKIGMVNRIIAWPLGIKPVSFGLAVDWLEKVD